MLLLAKGNFFLRLVPRSGMLRSLDLECLSVARADFYGWLVLLLLGCDYWMWDMLAGMLLKYPALGSLFLSMIICSGRLA